MTTKRISPVGTALSQGAIAGGIAVLFSLMGMVESFNDRDIISGVLSLGMFLILAVVVALGSVTSSRLASSRPGTRLASSALTGATAELFLVLLVLLGQTVNLRPVFPNASPELWTILQFGRTAPLSYVVMLVVGAVAGFLGAALTLAPRRVRNAVLLGLVAVVLVGMLEDLITTTMKANQALAASKPVAAFMKWLLASGIQTGLTKAGAVAVFLVFTLVGYVWTPLRTAARTRADRLPPRRRHTL
ncbi:MAG TPA: hypothetical protein VK449_09290, partial [Anaerolineales bacterium]|nr:hypothetical protein [Anaerolineales bacterium]